MLLSHKKDCVTRSIRRTHHNSEQFQYNGQWETLYRTSWYWKLIESNRHNLTITIFKEHMDYFGYVDGLKIKDMDKYETYMVYESILDDISPLDRVRLIFENEKLIAIVHSRDLAITNFETVPIERGRKLTLIKNFSTQEKKIFIEKNKETYRGID